MQLVRMFSNAEAQSVGERIAEGRHEIARTDRCGEILPLRHSQILSAPQRF
jgi:hypothetical protein